MPKVITEASKEAILRDLLNPTLSVKDVINIYRDVCSQQMIYAIGTEHDIDWDLRVRLEEALLSRNQLDALIREMESTFFNKVKRYDDEYDERPVSRVSYRQRPRRY